MRCGTVLVLCALAVAAGQRGAAQDRFGNLPISFEPNVGQTDERARFLARVPSMAVFFTDTEAVMVLDRIRRSVGNPGAGQDVTESVVKLRFAGANPPRSVEGLDRLPGVSNYYIGNDPARWHTGIPQYGRIAYRGIYPGVDLVAYGNHRQLEYDFVVAAQADPRQIQLEWAGVDALSLNADGDLVLQTSSGSIVQKRPRVYQDTPRGRVLVAGKYTLGSGRRVGFALARYDRRRPLIIDPQLVYSTYLGGSSADQAYAIAVDSTAAAYVAGSTPSANFPSVNPVHSVGGSLDAFIVKIFGSGTSLVYATYFGGGGNDKALGIALDSTGAAYVTGTTLANNFPTLAPFQPASGGDWDGFVTKFTPAGALSYSSYLGGSGLDTAQAIAVDSSGAAYIAGYTLSNNFPTTSGTIRTTNAGGYDAFVVKVAPGGASISYGTYLGGKLDDQAWAIAVDAAGSAYVTGNSASSDFPVVSAYQSTNKSSDDVFVTKLVPNGSALAYSTFVGGSARDDAYGIAVDASGNAYVAGRTQSADFPVVGAYQPKLAGNYDTFVFKLSPSGNALVYSTYVGGSGAEAAWGLAIDSGGNAYVGGWTQSTDFPTLSPVQTPQGNDDGIVYKLSADGSALIYSTYLGGSSNDYVQGIAVDAFGAAYVAGWTDSTNFITQAPIYTDQPSTDAFVAKIEQAVATGVGKAALTAPTPGSVFTGSSATFTWNPVSGATAYGLGVGVGQLNFNIFDAALGLATSQTVTGIPTNGATIFVRLFTQINGSVVYNDYTFKALRGGTTAVMSSPTPGSLIQGSSATFTWVPAANASSYRLDVGTALGAGDLFGSNVGLATSQAVSGLPADGSTIYVRLTTYNGSVALHNDYTYSAAGAVVSLRAVITSPVAGSTLPGASVTFTWTANPVAIFYWLQVGRVVASGNYFDGSVGLATSQTVTNLPIDGSKIYVRLWTRVAAGQYQYDDYTYTANASGLKPAILLTPTPGSTLSGSSVTFTWSAGSGATAYYLDVGKDQTTFWNYFSHNVGLALSQSVSGLPTDGSSINVRLWTALPTGWQGADYTFTASGPQAKASLLLPTPGTRLSGSSVTFTWDPGSGATAYYLDVGSSQGAGDVFSKNEALAISETVTGLPTNGTLYVRLWTQFGQSFQFNDYTYPAPGTLLAAIVSPTPGSGLGGTSATFTWTSATGASSYYLDVHVTAASSSIFSQNMGLATSATVNGLPTDGSTIWAELWTVQGNLYLENAYTYKAAGGATAVMSSPPPSSSIAGSSATFTWTAVSGATEYWLDVGTAAGGFDIFSQTAGTSTSATVNNLPPSGRTVYVRLWTVAGGVWQYNDYTYTIQ